MKRNKMYRNRRKSGGFDKLFDSIEYTVIRASQRPHNRFNRTILCTNVTVKMIRDYRKHRKMIRHGGYTSADIADMIFNQKEV